MKFKFFLLFGITIFVLTACQSAPVPTPEKQILETPHSNGPTSLPSVKGPTSPPPQSVESEESSPQAVTEVEKVQYTLQSAEGDFKN